MKERLIFIFIINVPQCNKFHYPYYCFHNSIWSTKCSPPPPVSRSVLAPLARRILTTAVQLLSTARHRGLLAPYSSLATLLGSAPLLRSRSADFSALKKQARKSGVTWGGVWEGWHASPLLPIHHQARSQNMWS